MRPVRSDDGSRTSEFAAEHVGMAGSTLPTPQRNRIIAAVYLPSAATAVFGGSTDQASPLCPDHPCWYKAAGGVRVRSKTLLVLEATSAKCRIAGAMTSELAGQVVRIFRRS